MYNVKLSCEKKNPRKVRSKNQNYFGFKKVKKYLSKMGWNVILSTFPENVLDFDDKIIKINNRCRHSTKLICLLHEIGHILLARKKYYNYLYPAGCIEYNKSIRRKCDRINILQEESAAWDIALLLAKSLKIKIDLDKFSKIRSSSLLSYARWADKNPKYGNSYL